MLGVRAESLPNAIMSFSQRLQESSSLESNHREARRRKVCFLAVPSSVVLFCRSQRCDVGCCRAPGFTCPLQHCPHVFLGPCCITAFLLFMLLPEAGSRSFPNHHRDDFSNDWCSFPRRTRASPAIRVSVTRLLVVAPMDESVALLLHSACCCLFGKLSSTAIKSIWFIAALMVLLIV